MIESPSIAQRQSADTPAPQADFVSELENAYGELKDCMAQLSEVLDEPELDRARLTTVRLRIAQLRLAQGPLIARITAHVAEKVSPSEADLLKRIRAGHDQMLREASAHTGKWTLDAIAGNWEKYRSATREIARCWMEKANGEQELLYPFLKR